MNETLRLNALLRRALSGMKPPESLTVSEWAEKHRLARRFICDLTFRTMIFAALGMLINVGYAAFNAVYGVIIAVNYGIIATSIWYCAVAVYYIILSVTRAVIIARTRNVNVNVKLTLQQQNMQKIKIYQIGRAHV